MKTICANCHEEIEQEWLSEVYGEGVWCLTHSVVHTGKATMHYCLNGDPSGWWKRHVPMDPLTHLVLEARDE